MNIINIVYLKLCGKNISYGQYLSNRKIISTNEKLIFFNKTPIKRANLCDEALPKEAVCSLQRLYNCFSYNTYLNESWEIEK